MVGVFGFVLGNPFFIDQGFYIPRMTPDRIFWNDQVGGNLKG